MKKKHVKIEKDDAVYAIGIVSKLLDIPEWTLRNLEKEGLIKPKRMYKKIRFYSMNDIERLEYIQFLMDEKGVNFSGIKIIMESNME